MAVLVNGHTTFKKENKLTDINGISEDDLRSYIERIERLQEELKALADDKKEIFAEAKGTGFDITAMKAILKLRKLDKAEKQEQEYMLELYQGVLGMSAKEG